MAGVDIAMMIELMRRNAGAASPPGGKSQDAYASWLKKYGVTEDPSYDTRGAFAAGLKPDARGHFDDTFKMPSHPTFSDESRYSTPENPGGRWVDVGHGKWRFEASPANLENMGPDQLMSYFDRVEPGNTLRLPDGTEYVGGSRSGR